MGSFLVVPLSRTMGPPARVHGEGPRLVPRPLSQLLAVPGLSEAQLFLLSVGGSHLVPVVLNGDPDVKMEQFQPLEELGEPELGLQSYKASQRRVLFQQRQSQAAVAIGVGGVVATCRWGTHCTQRFAILSLDPLSSFRY